MVKLGQVPYSPVYNFSWIVKDRVAGMARPTAADAERLRAEGVTALVSLTRRHPFPGGAEGLEVRHLPVVDFMPPTQEQMIEAVEFIDAALAAGGRAVVHCVAGYGRTGTVLASWLVSLGTAPGEAVCRVRESRPGSIETIEQEHSVHLFAETWRRHRARKEPLP